MRNHAKEGEKAIYFFWVMNNIFYYLGFEQFSGTVKYNTENNNVKKL
jgi:hypothetical protein